MVQENSKQKLQFFLGAFRFFSDIIFTLFTKKGVKTDGEMNADQRKMVIQFLDIASFTLEGAWIDEAVMSKKSWVVLPSLVKEMEMSARFWA